MAAQMRFWRLLISFAFALCLGTASESAEPANPKESEPQSKKSELQYKEPTKHQTPATISPPSFTNQSPGSLIDSGTANRQAPQEKPDTIPPSDAGSYINFIVTIFTGCLVGVGIAQVAVYKKQAKYMRRGLRLSGQAAKAAEQSLKLLQRPWIKIDLITFYPSTSAHKLHYAIFNVGHTPAAIKRMEIFSIDISPKIPNYPIEELPTGEIPTTILVLPQQPISHAYNCPAINNESFEALYGGSTKLFIRGWVVYDDIFGDRHVTRFCQMWNSGDPGKANSNFMIPPDAKHQYNEAT